MRSVPCHRQVVFLAELGGGVIGIRRAPYVLQSAAVFWWEQGLQWMGAGHGVALGSY